MLQSRFFRTCYGRMLKFIHCSVRNKLAGSSDIGFGGDRRSCRLSYGPGGTVISWFASYLNGHTECV